MLIPLGDNTLDIGAVLFDKDGTLLDSLGAWTKTLGILAGILVDRRLARRTLRPERDAIVQRLLSAIGVSDGKPDRRGLLASGTSLAVLTAFREALALEFGGEKTLPVFKAEASAILEDLLPSGAPVSGVVDGAEETLKELRGYAIPLGLATSDDSARTLADLDLLGLRGFFAFFSFGDTAAEPKPSPWSVREFSRHTGVPARRILVVGDTDADYEMARGASVPLFAQVRGTLSEFVPRLISGQLPRYGPGERPDFGDDTPGVPALWRI